jgi:hypothetical protein
MHACWHAGWHRLLAACLHTSSRPCLPSAHLPACRFKGLWGLGAMAQKLAKKSLEQTFADMPAIVDK